MHRGPILSDNFNFVADIDESSIHAGINLSVCVIRWLGRKFGLLTKRVSRNSLAVAIAFRECIFWDHELVIFMMTHSYHLRKTKETIILFYFSVSQTCFSKEKLKSMI